MGRVLSVQVIHTVGLAIGEVRFSVHKSASFFFLACVPARSLTRHVLMSVLLKMITRGRETR